LGHGIEILLMIQENVTLSPEGGKISSLKDRALYEISKKINAESLKEICGLKNRLVEVKEVENGKILNEIKNIELEDLEEKILK